MPAKTYPSSPIFGRLKVIGPALPWISKNGRSEPRSLCVCDCGNMTVVRNGDLRSGNTKSCGCYRVSLCVETHFSHGHAFSTGESKTHKAWQHMRERCSNPNNGSWKDYGGRGIKVCDRWQSFVNFVDDMGECPSNRMLERDDNDGNYEPGNCRWATRTEQNRNKRNNRLFTVDGITSCLAETCERTGISINTVKSRLRSGWPTDRLFDPSVYPRSKWKNGLGEGSVNPP